MEPESRPRKSSVTALQPGLTEDCVADTVFGCPSWKHFHCLNISQLQDCSASPESSLDHGQGTVLGSVTVSVSIVCLVSPLQQWSSSSMAPVSLR